MSDEIVSLEIFTCPVIVGHVSEMMTMPCLWSGSHCHVHDGVGCCRVIRNVMYKMVLFVVE